MVKVSSESQKIGEFIEWYRETYSPDHDWRGSAFDEPIRSESIERLLGRYFDVSVDEMERERMAVLAELRQDNKVQDSIKRKMSA